VSVSFRVERSSMGGANTGAARRLGAAGTRKPRSPGSGGEIRPRGSYGLAAAPTDRVGDPWARWPAGIPKAETSDGLLGARPGGDAAPRSCWPPKLQAPRRSQYV
jgi:hypothetical protein